MKSCVRMYEINTDEVGSDLMRCRRRRRPIGTDIYLVKFNSKGKKIITFWRDCFLLVNNTCPYYTNKRRLLGS